MAQYPAAVYVSRINPLTAGQLGGTYTNNATYSHASVHKEDEAEIVAIQTYLGTNATQTTPTATNSVLNSTSATVAAWTASPTFEDLTLTDDLIVGNNVTIQAGGILAIYDSGDDDWGQLYHDGSHFYIENPSSSVGDIILDNNVVASGIVRAGDGNTFQVRDSTGADMLSFSHDGTDAIIQGTTSVLMKDSSGDNFVYFRDGVNEDIRFYRNFFTYPHGATESVIRAYDNVPNKYIDIYHDATAGRLRVSAGNFVINTATYITGSLFGNSDGTYNLGGSGTRWNTVYATNGTINTSDEREKENIIDTPLGLDFISRLRPVQAKWKDFETEVPETNSDGEMIFDEDNKPVMKTEMYTHKRNHQFLIAQQVKVVMDELGIESNDFAGYIYDEEADKYGLRYTEFIGPIIKALQELNVKVEALENV